MTSPPAGHVEATAAAVAPRSWQVLVLEHQVQSGSLSPSFGSRQDEQSRLLLHRNAATTPAASHSIALAEPRHGL